MNFTVYSKDGCPFCTKVVQVLELAKLNHVVYKLGDHFDADGFYGQFYLDEYPTLQECIKASEFYYGKNECFKKFYQVMKPPLPRPEILS